MIIVQNNKLRKRSDYLALADLLSYGLDAICLKNCETCQHPLVCKEVRSTIDYTYKLSQQKIH